MSNAKKWYDQLRDGEHRESAYSESIPLHRPNPQPRERVSDQPTRICTGYCGRELANTPENFYYVGRPKYGDLLAPKCKDCAKGLYLPDGTRKPERPPRKPKLPVIDAKHQQCTRCLEWFEATEENFFLNGKRLRSQCKTCYTQSNAEARAKRTGRPAGTRRKPASVVKVETSDLRQIIELLDQHQIPDAESVLRRVEIALNQRRSFGVLAIDKARARVRGDSDGE